MSLKTWLEGAVQKAGFSLLPLDKDIMLDSSNLPGDFNSDPADCMLIASSRKTGATLVTRDQLILDYGKKNHVKVLQA